MKNKNLVVCGIYKNYLSLENGVDALKNAAFRSADISALLPSQDSTKQFAHEKHTKTPEEATKGAVSGAVVGGVLGWLAGIGSLAIPGVGPLIAAGPIMGLLAGASAGGTVGGVAGALIGMGIPEYEAKRFEGRIKTGGHLLSVHCDTDVWATKAKNILENTGAEDISSTDEAGSDDDDYVVEDKPRSVPRQF